MKKLQVRGKEGVGRTQNRGEKGNLKDGVI